MSGQNVMNKDPWQGISSFESFEYVRHWHEQEHGKQSNSAKTSQINAFFAQGREYFWSATSANLIVKPLLLYYGVLSMARGAILLKEPSKNEESLKQSHGLKVVNWSHTLKDGIKNVLELKVRATSGTFSELVAACPNRHIEHCFYGPSQTMAVVDHHLGEVRFSTDGSLLSLDDLLSRLMQTTFDYQGITGEKAKWFPVIITQHQTETHIALLSPHVLPDLQDIVYGASVKIKPTIQSWPNLLFDKIPQFSLAFQHETDKTHQGKFPVFHYTDGQQHMTAILDFPNKDKLSEFFKIYLTSYVLGMLARYYPSRWMSLIRGGPGDIAQPLVLKAIEAIETSFPAELSKQIPGHPMTLG